jgi:hypothetical protein
MRKHIRRINGAQECALLVKRLFSRVVLRVFERRVSEISAGLWLK